MFEIVTGLPANVLGIEARGTITHEDYRDVLIPRAEAMMKDGPIRVLYVVGEAFQTYELGALWDDGRFGLSHWKGFERIAVVSDLGWLRTSIELFKAFFPCPVVLFSVAELEAAKAWISAPTVSVRA